MLAFLLSLAWGCRMVMFQLFGAYSTVTGHEQLLKSSKRHSACSHWASSSQARMAALKEILGYELAGPPNVGVQSTQNKGLCMYVCMYACMYVGMYVWWYTCAHVYCISIYGHRLLDADTRF